MNAYRQKLLNEHRKPDWDKTHGCFTVSKLVKRFKARTIAEIGVCMGNTAAEVLNDNEIDFYFMVDHWKDTPELYEKVLKNFDADNVSVMRMDSSDALAIVPNECLDLVYIDAGHTYKKTRQDILGWYKKLKPGGVLVGDGFNHPRHPKYGVAQAVRKIFAKKDINVNLGPDSNFWVQKI